MPALGDVGSEVAPQPIYYTQGIAPAEWPDVSSNVPPTSGTQSTNPETFSAYIAG